MTIYAHKITSNNNINYSTSLSSHLFYNTEAYNIEVYNIEVENIILTMCNNHID